MFLSVFCNYDIYFEFNLNYSFLVDNWLSDTREQVNKGEDIWKGGTKEIFFWKHIEKDYHNFFFKPNNQNLKAVKRCKRDGKDRCDINSDSAWPCVVFEGPLMYLKAIFSSELQWGIGHYQHQPGLADVIEQRTAVDKKTDWYALDEDLGWVLGRGLWWALGPPGEISEREWRHLDIETDKRAKWRQGTNPCFAMSHSLLEWPTHFLCNFFFWKFETKLFFQISQPMKSYMTKVISM